MPAFEVQPDGQVVIVHDDGTLEAVPRGAIAARYAELVGEAADLDDEQLRDVLRAHMGASS
jgi:hypothetical protein